MSETRMARLCDLRQVGGAQTLDFELRRDGGGEMGEGVGRGEARREGTGATVMVSDEGLSSELGTRERAARVRERNEPGARC